ncbi:MAG: amino acid permease [Candidatus Bathyarchaeia archaeon]
MSPGAALVYNFITLSVYSASQELLYGPALYLFPGAEIGLACLSGAVVLVFMMTYYSILASAMPRSGGDYIYQSRILGPGIGFTLTFSTWVVWQFFYLGWYGFQFASMGLSPFLVFAGVYGNQPGLISLASWFMTPDGMMLLTAVVMIAALLISIKGMRFYVKALYAMVICVGSGALILAILPLTITHATFVANFNTVMSTFAPNIPNFYNYVMDSAKGASVNLSPQFSWGSTISTWSYCWFIFPYAIWSSNNMGEIKSANNLKAVFMQMFPALLLTAIYWAALYYVLSYGMGKDFLTAIGYIAYALPDAAKYFPITPFYTFLVGFSTNNLPLLFWALVVGVFFNVVGVASTILMGTTRAMFAMSFDRILPEKFAYIERKTRAPIVAMIVLVIGGLFFGYLINYRADIVGPYFASLTLGMIPTFVGSSIAAIVFPYRAKRIFEQAPGAKYRIAGVPLVVVAGIGGLIVNAIMAYYFLTVPALGFLVPASEAVVGGVYALTLVYYLIVRAYRKREGIDLALAFQDVPPE